MQNGQKMLHKYKLWWWLLRGKTYKKILSIGEKHIQLIRILEEKKQLGGKKKMFEEKPVSIPEWRKDELYLSDGVHRELNKMDEKKNYT